VDVHTMPDSFEGMQLITCLGDVQGKRILLPRSVQGSVALPAALTEAGAEVIVMPLYAPAPVEIGEEARLLLTGGVDVLTFASGSAVRSFVSCLDSDERFTDFWPKVVIACIGPRTADVARAAGLTVQVVASEHTSAGLVAALVAYYQGVK
jgi:uroporphyrinogen-III synthase